MQYRPLGNTDLQVSLICLGTMTWGEQNSEAEAHAQLDYALDHGINFIDTAEMYPVAARADTYGDTERIIGSWLKRTGRREDIVLATKVAGPADWLPWVRNGKARLDRPNIEAAIEDSLRRLNTDYVDLYQLHWPDRNTNYFGELGYTHDEGEAGVPVAETVAVLGDLIRAGKIRHWGLSNETPWGMMAFRHAADAAGIAPPVSVQNPYSLLNRTFEVGCAEVAMRERIGLLAYSPLGFGVLSGKYMKVPPKGSRLTLKAFAEFTRYTGRLGRAATGRYVKIAADAGLDPAQMALSWVNTRPFTTSNIVGATTLDQLKSNISSCTLTLPPEVAEKIEMVHSEIPNPCP